MTSLTDDEKREIARRFSRLRDAIDVGQPDVGVDFDALRRLYRGDCRAILDAFNTATDKRTWVGQLAVCLHDEIDRRFWDA